MTTLKESQYEMSISDSDIEGVLVSCPLIGKDLRPVSDCFVCPHYANLYDKVPDDQKGREFNRRYMVNCTHPTPLPLFLLRANHDGTK